MKTVVIALLSFFFTGELFAQNYMQDEFIIEYVENTSDADRQAVRDLLGVSNVTAINNDIELWSEIQFPIIFTENGEMTTIDNVEELLYYINIQEGDDEENTLASINNGDPNYFLSLVDDGTGTNATFDPLPFCDDQINTRLIGPIIEEGEQEGGIKIIIVDQAITIGNDVVTIDFDLADEFNSGGAHGNKIYSVIKNQLDQAGIEDVIFYNIELFDNEGTSSYFRLLETFGRLSSDTGPLSNLFHKGIMNFSANMIVNEQAESLILWEKWEHFIIDNGILLISSAGNEGSTSDNVFPAGANWLNEISVAGTQRCFYEPWEHTNSNPVDFDIAAEAQYVTVFDGQDFEIANGTSFSSAFVTGAAAQLAARCSTFDPIAIKNALLDYADINSNMINVVNQGRTLDVESSIRNWDNCKKTRGLQTQGNLPTSPLTLTTTPNPFSTTALVTIDLPEAGDVTINMYNMMGQRVHEEFISNQQELLEIEWPTPTKLARGTYLLRVQVGEAVEQMMMVKQ
jgi:hypothetical protein